MKKTLMILATVALAASAFAATDVATAVKPAVKHTARDVFAPFKYVGVGLGKGFKHLGQDMHIVKKAPAAPAKK